MGNIINFDFSSEKIKQLIEETKNKCIQVCTSCGNRFTDDTAKLGSKGLVLVCPKCGSNEVKVELKK